MSFPQLNRFLLVKLRTLKARATKLSKLTPALVGLRKQDMRYAPSKTHFDGANERLARIHKAIRQRLQILQQQASGRKPQRTLLYAALVEREIDRARRTFDLFFDVFSQRGSAFAPALAAHDVIARDCYNAIRQAAPTQFRGALVKPLTYLEHGYSPATMRRGVALSRLMGERNPFPLIRIPWDRDNPWQAVFLHEVSHNLQADLGLWKENKKAVTDRMIRAGDEPVVISTYARWQKEIFADLCAILLGGPASVWGMMDFLAHPHPKVMTYKPRGTHPTGYLRVFIQAEMLHRMGFDDVAGRVKRIWKKLYQPARGHRIPGPLLHSSSHVIPQVVDEIVYQPRRSLGQRALADIVPFSRDDEKLIRETTRYLLRGSVPQGVPPRFLVSASRHALAEGASPPILSKLVIEHLASLLEQDAELPQLFRIAA